MPMIYPHNAAVAAKHNLTQLIAFGTPGHEGIENITTNVAIEALADHQRSQLGLWHQTKKYSASMLAYGTVIGAPVAVVVGGTYYVLKDYIQDPKKIVTDFTGWGAQEAPEAAAASTSALVGPNGLMTATTAVATLATLGATDYAMLKTTGYQPVRAVMSWTANMISSMFVYAAYKAGELTTQVYAQTEKDAEAVREQTHKVIFNQNKAVFDSVADGLMQRAESFRDSPKDLFDLKRDVDRLEVKMSLFKSALAKLSLQKSEVSEVLDKLQTTIRTIQDLQFSLRKPTSQKDNKYNAELLSLLSEAQFADKALTAEARMLVEDIYSNTPGISNVARSYVYPILSGAKTAVATAAATSAAAAAVTYFVVPKVFEGIQQCVLNQECSVNTNGALLGVAIPALTAGFIAGQRVSKDYVFDAAKSAEVVRRNKLAAAKELSAVYDGVAQYLRSQTSLMTSRTLDLKTQAAIKDVKELAANVRAKIPLIHAQVRATGVIENVQSTTAELQRALTAVNQNPA